MKSYSGIVQKSSQRGTMLGFPTANIPLTDAAISGIYAAKVKVGERIYDAAAYADKKAGLLEAHLLDFPAAGESGDLYGRTITITLLKKIRDDKRFPTEDALLNAISDDVAKVRKYFTT